MKTVIIPIVLLFCICQRHKDSTLLSLDVDDTTNISTLAIDMPVIDEHFADSMNIGRKGLNKIEISQISTQDSTFVIIDFYTKQNNKWLLQNHFKYEKSGIALLDPSITDFNNDGLKDVTYISFYGARGANEVRRLLVYDKVSDQLVLIKNSEEYPNLQYNKKLNCIDAFLVSGGTTTLFLKLQGDSLTEFAGVHNADNYRRAFVLDKNGNEKVLHEKRISDEGIYIRYMNYNPPEPYTDR